MLEYLFNNFAGLKAPTQVFSSEYGKIFKNSFLYGTPLLAASENGFSEKFIQLVIFLYIWLVLLSSYDCTQKEFVVKYFCGY